MKTYRRHNCISRHRTYNKLARCMITNAEWVQGEGSYALIAWCRVPTITLHRQLSDAEAALEFLNRTACGGACSRRHEIVLLVNPEGIPS